MMERHYSGSASKPFWTLVRQLEKRSKQRELWTLALLLQTTENTVIAALENTDRTAPKTKRKRPRRTEGD